jgi:hypothetical protein
MRLVIADSSVIDEEAIYPIPPEFEQTLISRVLQLFIPSNPNPQTVSNEQ